jgi:hypothetical protein
MMVTYKDVINYESIYKISSDGQIINKKTNKIIKPNPSKWKSYSIRLTRNYVSETFQIHRLVAEHFIKDFDKGKSIMHIDGDNSNNNIDNLRLCSTSELNKQRRDYKCNNYRFPTLAKSKKFELWATVGIKGFNNYTVSTRGKVINKQTGKRLTPIMIKGYQFVGLYGSENLKSKLLQIHRLVAITFIYNRNPLTHTYVDHKNNIKTDNCVDNLHWVTCAENNQLYIANFKKESENAILQLDKDSNLIKEWRNMREIINQNPTYSDKTIYQSIKDKGSRYSFYWQYKNQPKNFVIDLRKDEKFKNMGKLDDHDFTHYEISNYGTFRNISTNNFLRSSPDSAGYSTIRLFDKITKEIFKDFVHYYVATIFIGKKPIEKHVVNHIDENKANNHYKNLEWASRRHNSEHSLAKRVNQIDISTGKISKTFESIARAGEAIGKPSSSIVQCCKGKQRLAFGFKWEYADPIVNPEINDEVEPDK